ncbi:hypothetical protein RHODGE_RHODGE_01026 [Rhodoplanes serenus]|uniref:Peptidase S24/S26A/S26B/S26C domain-containing protein n=1 Tax=Rhodoplanes serenus TaxID=200615 RepID=A0A3S4DDV2_9BRAD|nr:hypothetical protein [Rhodoplanes serenus]VCU06581.1 hypothetical protein RHODPL_RHODPL_00029 [Rhodoplanes serenus]VCU07876.1 hypothetical protein RHODGE_RHODGE_01026 [Rhodoplanes serenus]
MAQAAPSLRLSTLFCDPFVASAFARAERDGHEPAAAVTKPAPILPDAGDRLRPMPVTADNMVPTLDVSDFVMVAPMDGFAGNGIYVLDMLGAPKLCRITRVSSDRVLVSHDHQNYPSSEVSRATIDALIIAKAVCKIEMLDRMVTPDALVF